VDERLEGHRDQLFEIAGPAVRMERLVGEHCGEERGPLEPEGAIDDDPLATAGKGDRAGDRASSRIAEGDPVERALPHEPADRRFSDRCEERNERGPQLGGGHPRRDLGVGEELPGDSGEPGIPGADKRLRLVQELGGGAFAVSGRRQGRSLRVVRRPDDGLVGECGRPCLEWRRRAGFRDALRGRRVPSGTGRLGGAAAGRPARPPRSARPR
jgi:hypothetical protein